LHTRGINVFEDEKRDEDWPFQNYIAVNGSNIRAVNMINSQIQLEDGRYLSIINN
jgi:hypothetical protein